MEVKRAVMTAHPQKPETFESSEHEPSSDQRRPVLDPDETAALVNILYHAQQTVAASADFIAGALDSNDEELASFMEESQRESSARVDKAKALLAARLHARRAHAAPTASIEHSESEAPTATAS